MGGLIQILTELSLKWALMFSLNGRSRLNLKLVKVERFTVLFDAKTTPPTHHFTTLNPGQSLDHQSTAFTTTLPTG